jgi:hypothetical protein
MQQLSKAKVKKVLAGQRAMHMRDPRKKHLDFLPLCGSLIAAQAASIQTPSRQSRTVFPFFLPLLYHGQYGANPTQS